MVPRWDWKAAFKMDKGNMNVPGYAGDQSDADLDAMLAASEDHMLAAIQAGLDLEAGLAKIIGDPPRPGTVGRGDELAAARPGELLARKFALLARQGELAGGTLDKIYDDARRLAWAYPQRPLTSVLPDLVMTQDTIFALLEGRRRPASARQLYLLGGVVGGMLAKASHDMADPLAALTQSRTAYLCADQADHDGLRAWIRGLQALITYWDGRLKESVRYAQQGAQFAGRGRSTATVWLPVSEARAWAALGNVPAARRAIDSAEAAWENVQGDELDELGGLCTFSRPRQLYYSADALAWLPTEAAWDFAEQAVTAYDDVNAPEWAFGDASGSRCNLAIARINLGEIEGAREAIAPVLDLPVEQRIRGIISSIQHVHEALRRPNLPQAGSDLQEEIEVFTKVPLRSFPA